MSSSPRVEESIDIAVAPRVAFAAVSDPRNYSRWSPEARGARLPHDPPLTVGERFTGHNSLWARWSSECTVVTNDPDYNFSFEVRIAGILLSRWTYVIDDLTGSGAESLPRCRVTEQWDDLRRGPLTPVLRRLGLFVGRGTDAARRNAETMRYTLERLRFDLEGASQ